MSCCGGSCAHAVSAVEGSCCGMYPDLTENTSTTGTLILAVSPKKGAPKGSRTPGSPVRLPMLADAAPAGSVALAAAEDDAMNYQPCGAVAEDVVTSAWRVSAS